MFRCVVRIAAVTLAASAAFFPAASGIAEPYDTDPVPACSGATATAWYTKFGLDNHKIYLDVYQPATGTNLPAVLLIHGGGWKSGSKCNDHIQRIATYFQSRGIVAFAIDYRLSCDPLTAEPSVDDTALCVGPGLGTVGNPNEAQDDAQAAMHWVRRPFNTNQYNVDQSRVGAQGLSAGGNLAGLLGVTGTAGDDRADAVVSWSGASKLEIPTNPTNGARADYIGCPYSGAGSCPQAWDNASPYWQCCGSANVAAATPFLIFNSDNELIDAQEANNMYTRLSTATPTAIPVTKVILYHAGHAGAYKDHVITTAGCGSTCDTVTSNESFDPSGKTVEVASADYFLSRL